MKDFFDIWLLSRQFDYNGETLAKAIMKTFSTRRTEIPYEPIPLTEALATDSIKVRQWYGFIRKSRLINIPEDFVEIIEGISTFLGPIARGLSSGQAFNGVWKAPGTWAS